MDARSDSSTAARFRDDRDAEHHSVQAARSLQAAAVALREATRTCTAALDVGRRTPQAADGSRPLRVEYREVRVNAVRWGPAEPANAELLDALAEAADRLAALAEAAGVQLPGESGEPVPPAPGGATPPRAAPPLLTPRQLEILAMVADGMSTEQIAEGLWLSVATVRNHVARTLRALDAHSRVEAVAKARRLGLL
jgi:DNA-binding NarL/FixJ family response regulator